MKSQSDIVLGSFSTMQNFPRGMIISFLVLLTPTLHQLVFKQIKMLLCMENSAKWKMAFDQV